MRRLLSIVKIMAVALLAASAVSCEWINNLIHDDVCVAKVGKHKLYRSDVLQYLPAGITSEDSLNLSMQYINSWATEHLFVDEAELGLSKEEKDLDREIEEYRNSLLRFRYEQKYVNDNLDTLVTSDEILSYWENHQELFMLDIPVAKARLLDIGKTSASLEELTSYMVSSNESDLALADSLAFGAAFMYSDHSSVWVSLNALCRELGVDMAAMLPLVGKDKMASLEGEGGDLKIIYATDIVYAGNVAPLDYCSERIKDIILNTRKRALVGDLEVKLREQALDSDKMKIYQQ